MLFAFLGLAIASDRAFDPGDVDVRVGWGTTPRVRGTAGLAMWGLSWWATEGSVDVGVVRKGPVALSLGAEGGYSRPWVTQGFVNGVLDAYVITNRIELAAEAWSLGARGRVTFAGRDEAIFQPYLVLGVGQRRLLLSSAWAGSVVRADASYELRSWHVSPGTGIGLVLGKGFLLSWEARLNRGVSARATATGDLAVGPYDIASAEGQNSKRDAPRGLTYAFSAGWRF
ncbi:MAG: hypothetical protein GY913_26715 [Proteobacteria bacterium]|nr:hypothetical protein [Pseudomonadota bacterium]MCP4920509.1 hypothetical protein [Pseudomonadota bacterium]